MKIREKKIKISKGYNIFREIELPLKRFLGRFFHRPEDVDDLAQETFLRAYKGTVGRDMDFPKAYIFKIARNIALKELSKNSRRLTDYLEEVTGLEQAETSLLEDEVIAEQKVQMFLNAIADLPPQCRKVFIMRKVMGLSHKSIGNELNISSSAVEKHIALGVERCKEFYDQAKNARVDMKTEVSSIYR